MNLASLPLSVLGSSVELAVRSALAPSLFAARWLGMPGGVDRLDMPSPSRSLGTSLKAAFDEIFLLTEVLSAPLVDGRDSDRVRGDLAAAVELFDRRGWLSDPARFHRRPPALRNPTITESWTAAGRRFEHVTFDSRFDLDAEQPGRERWLGHAANQTGHAWMLRHPGPPRPWVVCVHGYRMGFPLADFFGFQANWLHDTLGLNVLFPILPMHGPRKVGYRTGDGAISGHFLDFLHLQAQGVWDVRRLLGWLRDQQNAPAVALYGVSLGACTAGLVASLEDSLACVIAGVPLTCYLRLVQWNLPQFVLSWGEQRGIAWTDVEQLVRVVSPLALIPRVSRDRRFIFAATRDQLVPPQGVRDLWWHWGRPTIQWYDGSHVSFLGEPVVRRVVGDALSSAGLIPAAPQAVAAAAR